MLAFVAAQGIVSTMEMLFQRINCPIQYKSIEKEPCVLSCAEQACIFSSWSEYSGCFAPSCGVGEMTRSRRLLHYPAQPRKGMPSG